MEKRVTLALILCTFFVFGYMYLIDSTRPPADGMDPSAEAPDETGEGDGSEPGEPGQPPTASDSTAEPGTPATTSGGATPDENATGGVDVAGSTTNHRVETDRFLIDFTSRGAVPTRVLLRGITRESGLDASVEENLVAIVDTFEPGRSPLLFKLGDRGVDLSAVDWHYRGESTDGTERIVTFDVTPGNGLKFIKRFRLADGRDDIRVNVEIVTLDPALANTSESFRMVGAAGVVYEGDPERPHDLAFGVCRNLGARGVRVAPSAKIQKSGALQYNGNIEWAAVVSKYFAAILKPLALPSQVERVEYTPISSPELYEVLRTQGLDSRIALERSRKKVAVTFEMFDSLAAEGRSIQYDFLFYLGLKERRRLSEPDYLSMKAVLDESGMSTCGMGGIVKPIAALLMLILSTIYSIVGNYGIAIILLTIIVKLVMFPMTRHQQVTMAAYQSKMQKYKPELDKIREKYKNNKQKLNQKTLEFFKEKGINPFPLGGCLPMLATLPIFFGLFYLLRTAPELRQAPFMGWITDLARPDQAIEGWPDFDFFCMHIHGLNVLPILMTVAWFIQQRAMPKSDDPQQRQTQQMMMFMPIVFGFMLYDFASGLSLYWLTNSLVGIIEQKIIRRRIAAAKA